MRSVMKHRFSEVPRVDIPRSRFDRSHGYKTTFDAGYLVPFFVDEALPGDTFDVRVQGFARLATPIYPVMDNMFMETFFFAVPIRLIWDNWPKFCGEQVDPGDSVDYTVPTSPITAVISAHTLHDYMGLPVGFSSTGYSFNNLPFRAYNLIWNEWFRDQNLQDSVTVDKDDGPDSGSDYVLLRRCKKHDYFTSCLPWLQKGDAVSLPLGDTADVFSTADMDDVDDADNRLQITKDQGGTTAGLLKNAGTNYNYFNTASTGSTTLFADLEDATAATVNELRQAIQVQRLLEREARSGTRYTEIINSHFGVVSPDSRMQRPEYLGGGSTPVNVSPIARTDSSPGVLGAMGVSAFRNHGFIKSFTEHCYVIGLVNVRADLTYQEGLERMWWRETKYDFYWPTLAHLGEQSVLNREIYMDQATVNAGTHEDVFGYQERYAEYRYKPSKITGKFRSTAASPIDEWHLGIEFGSLPTLDDTFIQDDPPVDRVIATPTEPHFIFDSYINMNCTRPMPTYSVPGLIDHF